MWRDVDPRSLEHDRPDPSRGSRGASDASDRLASNDPRGALTRDLDLPRGLDRERVRSRGLEYELRGSEVRTLAAAGTFRVVPAADLRDLYDDPGRQRRELTHLRERGLIQTTPYVVGRTRTTLVTLTERGRAVLEDARRERGDAASQGFYAGISRRRELAHDVRLYRTYVHAAERLVSRGARVRRVVLESELKRDYQRFLQRNNRGRPDGSGRPERDVHEIARWAREHQLPCHDGHVEFPDARIEYDERDGRRGIEDIEVVTPHYRGAHAAAKARSGFSCYRSVGARLGGAGRTGRGGRGVDPRLAEELLS
jgi:DNA-binding MarR family transcriptional regulator